MEAKIARMKEIAGFVRIFSYRSFDPAQGSIPRSALLLMLMPFLYARSCCLDRIQLCTQLSLSACTSLLLPRTRKIPDQGRQPLQLPFVLPESKHRRRNLRAIVRSRLTDRADHPFYSSLN